MWAPSSSRAGVFQTEAEDARPELHSVITWVPWLHGFINSIFAVLCWEWDTRHKPQAEAPTLNAKLEVSEPRIKSSQSTSKL